MILDGSITIHKLQVFCSVVRFGSVTKAAERLRIAQPAVTSHIRQLENKLGVNLFIKRGRALILTDGGERTYRWAQDVLNRSKELQLDIGRLKEGLAGTVTLVTTMAIGSYRVADVAIGFLLKHPHARVITHIANPVQATETIRNGDCDLGIMLLDPTQRHDELIVELLWREPHWLVARKGSRHLSPDLGLERINSVPFVTPPTGLVTRAIEDDLLRNQGITHRNVIAEFGHPESIKRALLADIAVSFLAASTVQAEIKRGELIHVDVPEFRSFFMSIYLVYRANNFLSEIKKNMIKEIKYKIQGDN